MLESHDDFIGRELLVLSRSKRLLGPIHSFINSIRIKTSNIQQSTQHTHKQGWIPNGKDTTSLWLLVWNRQVHFNTHSWPNVPIMTHSPFDITVICGFMWEVCYFHRKNGSKTLSRYLLTLFWLTQLSYQFWCGSSMFLFPDSQKVFFWNNHPKGWSSNKS